MSRRLTTLILGAFYLLQATWLLHAGMDLLLPPVRQVVATIADSCCTNTCGCPEDVKAAGGCCCIKTPVAQIAQPAQPRPVSALEAARCKGTEEAMTQAFTQPVLAGFASPEIIVLDGDVVSFPDFKPLLLFSAASLEKVPIARA